MAWRIGVDSGVTFTDICLFRGGAPNEVSRRLRFVETTPQLPKFAEVELGESRKRLLADGVLPGRHPQIKRRGVEMRFAIDASDPRATNPDPVLLREVKRARRCFDALVSGRIGSVAELASLEGYPLSTIQQD